MWPAQMPAVAAQTLHYNSTENPELSQDNEVLLIIEIIVVISASCVKLQLYE